MWKHKMKCSAIANENIIYERHLLLRWWAYLRATTKKSLVSFFIFNWPIFFVCFVSNSYILLKKKNLFVLMKQRETHWFISCLRIYRVLNVDAIWVWHQFAVLRFFPHFHIMNCIILFYIFIRKFGYLLLFDKQKCENHCYLFQ